MMKLIFLILLSLPLFAQDVRLDRHQEASEAFKNLHFFYKGRGMSISPDLIKLYKIMSDMGIGTSEQGIINQRWGLQFEDNQAKGIYAVPYEGMQVGVLGCVACHSGKAAGEYIIGLGNKNIDVGQIGKDAYLGMKLWGALPRSNPKFRELHNRSLEFTKGLSTPQFSNLTQGLVPTSLIRSWFYKVQNIPFPNNFPRGQVKVPHLWGYGEKRKSGSFWDGEGNGELGGWGIAVELYAGQTPENVREYYDRVHLAEDYLGDFLPPKYPFKINMKKAQAGEKIFISSCKGCHGEHIRDVQGHPIYLSPKHIPWRVVKTDRDRLNALTEELYDLIERNPLNDVIQSVRKKEPGYVAPKLWGIWARFPYLHNASVPTIYDLLTEPGKRPRKFSLRSAGEKERFDEGKMGLTILTDDFMERRLYDTQKKGQSNEGHYFDSFKNFSHENKLEIIEYLKTL
jgi:mono/diheme cytochrome c family protein